MLWCVILIIVTLLIRRKTKRLEQAAGIGVPDPIKNPVFKALYDEYRQNKLERLTKNDLFRNWKLDAIDDAVDDKGKRYIFLDFTKKDRNIILEMSEKWAVVAVDEEAGNDEDLPVLPMDSFLNPEELFTAVTELCISELEKPAK